MGDHASIEGFDLTLKSFLTPVGLEIAAVRLWGERTEVQTDPFGYRLEEPAELEALILAPHLEAFVRTKVPGNVESLDLSLVPEKVLVKATVRVLIPVTATATCTLRIEQGKRVFVVLESVEMLGAGVKSLVQKQIDAINPVLDVSTWPLDVYLDEIRIEEGRLIVAGRAAPPVPKS